ncbi:MAG TPA: hypothetical protein VJ890_09240 [Vineibacter sp.]|nr:hypothetical protein [Vineibacter sp.]
MSFWETPQVHGALVSGVFALFTALLGVGVLSWQLSRQAQNSAKANRQTEALKLKKEVYDQTSREVKRAQNAVFNFRTYVAEFDEDLERAITAWEKEQKVLLPKAREKTIKSLGNKAVTRLARLADIPVRWLIIDERFMLFNKVFSYSSFNLLNNLVLYYEARLMMIPNENENGEVARWSPPSKSLFEVAKGRSDEMINACIEASNWIDDFDTEMQVALIGELFDTAKPNHQKEGRTTEVIEIARIEELDEHFNRRRGALSLTLHNSLRKPLAALKGSR